jgi:hypothetical protein
MAKKKMLRFSLERSAELEKKIRAHIYLNSRPPRAKKREK